MRTCSAGLVALLKYCRASTSVKLVMNLDCRNLILVWNWDRTCRPQTDSATRQDTSVTRLRWVKSLVRQTHPARSIAAVTTALLVTGRRTSCCEGLRVEDRPRRGGLIYEPEWGWGAVAHVLNTAFLPHQPPPVLLPVSICCLLTAGTSWNDKPPRENISPCLICWVLKS